jgi:DNA (cytosine-5)-methyltransferase 1
MTSGPSQLVLSLFPGIDLLGRGFEAEGFCVVRGPDPIFGGDIAEFRPTPGRFDAVIGGSPCPDFSTARRSAPTGDGAAMLEAFARVITEAAPQWWLLENVPGCPDVKIAGYSHQRLDVDPRDVGAAQRRLRHFQFGDRDGRLLALARPSRRGAGEPACLATEANKPGRRNWPRFCALQGLPESFDLPGWTVAAKYRAVGNGVHLQVAQLLARAGAAPLDAATRLCACSCGRPVDGKATSAGPACRKRLERRRRLAMPLPAAGDGLAARPGPALDIGAL